MILTASSSSSVKEPMNYGRRYSELPPSYDAVEAERHAFLVSTIPEEPHFQPLPEPPVYAGPSMPPGDPLTPNRMIRDVEPTTLYLDPESGEAHTTHMVSDALLAQCGEVGHVEKTRFRTLSILGAAVFFPWGLLCLINSRVVYCDRCRLVLRGPRGCKIMRREQSHKQGHR